MKAFFLSRLFREKVLLLAFVATGAIIWLSSVSSRLKLWSDDHRRTTAELNEQQMWLDQRERIEGEAMAAIQNLDPARSFNSVRLSAELGNLAAAAGVGANTTSEVQQPVRTEQFAVNLIRLRMTRVEWPALKSFYLELSKRAPYITIEKLRIDPDRANPNSLTAQLEVAAVEITQPR